MSRIFCSAETDRMLRMAIPMISEKMNSAAMTSMSVSPRARLGSEGGRRRTG
ncbi:MAG: hypothetical protein R3F11_17840 [Verrucomicrobiales bacterium]